MKLLNKLLPTKKKSKELQNANNFQHIYKMTESKIREGLLKPTASTGKPIAELRGNAKFLAQLSNIGGGSKETGGGGVKDGLNTIVHNKNAKFMIDVQKRIKKK